MSEISVVDLTLPELQQMAWDNFNVRVHPRADLVQINDFLQYKADEVPLSPVDAMREEIMDFIHQNHGRLSLPCHGNCREHHDAVVVWCHNQLKKG